MEYNIIIGFWLLFNLGFLSVCSTDTIGDIEDNNILRNYMDERFIKRTFQPTPQTTFVMPDEKWISTALKDIAYYLRNYKFNNWDQRYYYKKPLDEFVGFYNAFPIPTLKSLHWKVYENCDTQFYKCITYLHSIIETVPFGRNNDVVSYIKKQTYHNETFLKKLNADCEETRSNSEKSSIPFESVLEKFQWRASASYYMCWYTMLGTPTLSMLGETCDNFANCLDPKFGYRNRDPRSNDRLSFACALYSFCPDPCCPVKHIDHLNQCLHIELNPCFYENRNRNTSSKMCLVNKKENANLEDIMNNKWNVTCNCTKPGFVWKSQFGICVDVNECLSEKNVCNNITEDCFNTPGSYTCICKWEFRNKKSKKNMCKKPIVKDNDDNASKKYDSSFVSVIWQWIGL